MIPWQKRTLGLLAAWPVLMLLALAARHVTMAPWLALADTLWGWTL